MIRLLLLTLCMTMSCAAIGQEPWLDVEGDNFHFNGSDSIADHLTKSHPNAEKWMVKLHEWLHQEIEKQRPEGAKAFIAFEGTEQQLQDWPHKDEIEAAGWKVVRMPGTAISNVVAIGKTHYAVIGYLTKAKLRELVSYSQPKPVRSPRARFVKSIKMFTRQNCSWCEKWISQEMPKATADGVEVDFEYTSSGSVPRFEVCTETECKQFTGFTTYSQMKGNG